MLNLPQLLKKRLKSATDKMNPDTKIIIGLGNPGNKYANTRHNAGFMFIDYLINKYKPEQVQTINKFSDAELYFIRTESLYLLKPLTYMNLSGVAAQKVISYYKIPTENITLVYDDLDIQLGDYKISQNKYPKDHNGIASIVKHLNTADFKHIRIGVDNRTPDNRMNGEEYVLVQLQGSEKEKLETILTEIQSK